MQALSLSESKFPSTKLGEVHTDIINGALNIDQNKTRKKLRIAIEEKLKEVINRIINKKAMSLILINTENGQPINTSTLRGTFDRARNLASANNPDLSKSIKEFQFRDLRAKAGTDKEESSGIATAQDQLGHATPVMTAHYVRHRRGKLVKPTK